MASLGAYLRRLYEQTIGILLILLLWEIIPRTGIIHAGTLPPFSSVLAGLGRLLVSGDFSKHFWASFFRAMTSFGLASLFTIPLGFLIGWYPRAARIMDPILQFLRNLPALALYPLFILLFGLGEVSKVAIIIKGTMWPILMNTTEGVKEVDPLHIKSARSMGCKNLALFRKVLFPAAFPFILAGLRLGATRSILLLVGAEMMGADEGLGFLIFDMQHKYEIPEMYAAIIIMVLIGLSTNWVLKLLEKKATRWKEELPTQ